MSKSTSLNNGFKTSSRSSRGSCGSHFDTVRACVRVMSPHNFLNYRRILRGSDCNTSNYRWQITAWEIAKNLMTSSFSGADYKTRYLYRIISHNIQHQIKHPAADAQGDSCCWRRKQAEQAGGGGGGGLHPDASQLLALVASKCAFNLRAAEVIALS